jgi:hypothetical protein
MVDGFCEIRELALGESNDHYMCLIRHFCLGVGERNLTFDSESGYCRVSSNNFVICIHIGVCEMKIFNANK